jgi:DNA mismatch endonuclease, patch repair protein
MRRPVSTATAVSAGVPAAGTRPVLVNGLPYPHPTSTDVTIRMRRNTRTGTHPEVIVRSELHRRGLRFRKDLPLRMPGRVVRPDIVFTRARLAVFIDGCFWHSCPIHGNQPRANTDYWRGKLAINVARDRAIDEELTTAGWRVLRAWEHEHPADVAARVLKTLTVAYVS